MSRVRRVRGRSCFASRGGIRLHYLEYGEGDRTMVILPGITSPAATWEFVAEPLADGLRVVTWDARGRGLSDHPSSGYAMADYAGDLDMLLERLDLDRPVILGHSMGARVATYFAARHPERVGPLIIVDPPLMGPGRPYATPLDAYIDELRSAQAGELSVEDLRESWPTWDDDRLLDREEWLPTCSEQAVRESYERLLEDDLADSWPRLGAPLALIRGADSPAVSAEGEAELRVANPAAEFIAIAGAGHMVPYDNLDDFLSSVRAVLASSYAERTD